MPALFRLAERFVSVLTYGKRSRYAPCYRKAWRHVRKEERLLWLSLLASLYPRLSAGNRCLTSALPRLNSTQACPPFFPFVSLELVWKLDTVNAVAPGWYLLRAIVAKSSWSLTLCYTQWGHLFIKSYLRVWILETCAGISACVLENPPTTTPTTTSSNRSQVVCGDCKCFPRDFCGWPSLNRFWLDGITCFVIQRNNSVRKPPPPSPSPRKLLRFLCVGVDELSVETDDARFNGNNVIVYFILIYTHPAIRPRTPSFAPSHRSLY